MTGSVVVTDGTVPPPPPPPPPGGGDGATVTTDGNEFNPERVFIAPGGSVTWQFSGGIHNVTFEDTAPPGGDIPDTSPGNAVTRTFPSRGDYDYECSHHSDMKGRVRVE
jgi:plastocyanin